MLPLKAHAQEVLTVAVTGGWHPYVYKDASFLDGIDIRLVKAIADDAGIDLKFVILPFKRCHADLQEGRIDMILGASYTNERSWLAFFSSPYRKEEIALLTRNDILDSNNKIYKEKSLFNLVNHHNIMISAEDGAWYGNQFNELLYDKDLVHNIHLNHKNECRVSMVLSDRVDMAIGDKIALKYEANIFDPHSNRLAFHPMKFDTVPIHLMLSKASVTGSTVEKINNSIHKLKRNGKLKNIFDSFLSEKNLNIEIDASRMDTQP